MKTKTEIEQEITNITNIIHQKFPELSNYLLKNPIKTSGNDETDVKNLEIYFQSLEELVNNYINTDIDTVAKSSTEMSEFPGYPTYPSSNDIYQQSKEESELNPENLSKKKTPNKDDGTMNEKSFKDDMVGDDLDVPGSELDDQQESVGSEDEENNYYSLGGDNHNDLDEDNGIEK